MSFTARPANLIIQSYGSGSHPTGYTGEEYAKWYNFPPQYGSTRPKIGIISAGSFYFLQDLKHYWTNILHRDINSFPTITNYFIDPSASTYVSSNDYGVPIVNYYWENNLDLQIVLGACPNADIYFYSLIGSNGHISSLVNTSWTTLFQQMVTDGIDVVSCSWGFYYMNPSNTHPDELINTYLTKNGIIMCNASGDSQTGNGSTGTYPAWPCDSPNVISVGGTSLINTKFYDINNTGTESVWVTVSGSGSGGGFSPSFNLLDCQRSLVPAGTTFRSFPDISLNADSDVGYLIYFTNGASGANGVTGGFGGTSASAPLFASFLALMGANNIYTDYLSRRGLSGHGNFINELYKPYLNFYPSIMSGYNDIILGSDGIYSGATGFDQTTGMGSINGKILSYIINTNLSDISVDIKNGSYPISGITYSSIYNSYVFNRNVTWPDTTKCIILSAGESVYGNGFTLNLGGTACSGIFYIGSTGACANIYDINVTNAVVQNGGALVRSYSYGFNLQNCTIDETSYIIESPDSSSGGLCGTYITNANISYCTSSLYIIPSLDGSNHPLATTYTNSLLMGEYCGIPFTNLGVTNTGCTLTAYSCILKQVNVSNTTYNPICLICANYAGSGVGSLLNINGVKIINDSLSNNLIYFTNNFYGIGNYCGSYNGNANVKGIFINDIYNGYYINFNLFNNYNGYNGNLICDSLLNNSYGIFFNEYNGTSNSTDGGSLIIKNSVNNFNSFLNNNNGILLSGGSTGSVFIQNSYDIENNFVVGSSNTISSINSYQNASTDTYFRTNITFTNGSLLGTGWTGISGQTYYPVPVAFVQSPWDSSQTNINFTEYDTPLFLVQNNMILPSLTTTTTTIPPTTSTTTLDKYSQYISQIHLNDISANIKNGTYSLSGITYYNNCYVFNNNVTWVDTTKCIILSAGESVYGNGFTLNLGGTACSGIFYIGSTGAYANIYDINVTNALVQNGGALVRSYSHGFNLQNCTIDETSYIIESPDSSSGGLCGTYITLANISYCTSSLYIIPFLDRNYNTIPTTYSNALLMGEYCGMPFTNLGVTNTGCTLTAYTCILKQVLVDYATYNPICLICANYAGSGAGSLLNINGAKIVNNSLSPYSPYSSNIFYGIGDYCGSNNGNAIIKGIYLNTIFNHLNLGNIKIFNNYNGYNGNLICDSLIIPSIDGQNYLFFNNYNGSSNSSQGGNLVIKNFANGDNYFLNDYNGIVLSGGSTGSVSIQNSYDILYNFASGASNNIISVNSYQNASADTYFQNNIARTDGHLLGIGWTGVNSNYYPVPIAFVQSPWDPTQTSINFISGDVPLLLIESNMIPPAPPTTTSTTTRATTSTTTRATTSTTTVPPTTSTTTRATTSTTTVPPTTSTTTRATTSTTTVPPTTSTTTVPPTTSTTTVPPTTSTTTVLPTTSTTTVPSTTSTTTVPPTTSTTTRATTTAPPTTSTTTVPPTTTTTSTTTQVIVNISDVLQTSTDKAFIIAQINSSTVLTNNVVSQDLANTLISFPPYITATNTFITIVKSGTDLTGISTPIYIASQPDTTAISVSGKTVNVYPDVVQYKGSNYPVGSYIRIGSTTYIISGIGSLLLTPLNNISVINKLHKLYHEIERYLKYIKYLLGRQCYIDKPNMNYRELKKLSHSVKKTLNIYFVNLTQHKYDRIYKKYLNLRNNYEKPVLFIPAYQFQCQIP